MQTPGSALNADFSSDWKLTSSDSFSYSIDTTKLSTSDNSNTFSADSSNAITGYSSGGTPYGAGLTISFFYHNVFGVGSLTLATGSLNI